MKKIMLLAFLASTMLIQAQNGLTPTPFHFRNPATVLPGRIFGTEIDNGPLKHQPPSIKKNLQSASLLSIPVLDSFLLYAWDTSSNAWQVYYKISDITYNDANLPKTYTNYEWDGSEWIASLRYVVGFDANNNIINEIEQSWEENEWVNDRRFLSVFDEFNNRVSEVYQVWNEDHWEDRVLTTYAFDANHNWIASQTQRFNGTEWVNETYITNTKEHHNQLSITSQTWDETEWVNVGRYVYTYDGTDKVTSNTYQEWINDQWENNVLYTFLYDAFDNLTTEEAQHWLEDEWVNFISYNLTYDQDNQLINQLAEIWTGTDWINADYYTYTYDVNGHKTNELRDEWNDSVWIHQEESAFKYEEELLYSEVYKYFNPTGDAIMYGDSAHYYFNAVTSTESSADLQNGILIYPNPASDVFYLFCENENAIIHISDFTGRPVLTQPANKGINLIYSNDLSDGAYLIRLVTNELPYNSITRLVIAR
ncbi:MAG: T9SS type A sorting domain-containing protein [Saprospiraceae bacterium]